MAKKSKLKTPDWILKGDEEKSPKKKKEKTFKVRRCPKCNSDKVLVKIGDIGIWECVECDFKGKNVKEEQLTEDEFMKYLDEKGEEVA